jgi:hypothetical protein
LEFVLDIVFWNLEFDALLIEGLCRPAIGVNPLGDNLSGWFYERQDT